MRWFLALMGLFVLVLAAGVGAGIVLVSDRSADVPDSNRQVSPATPAASASPSGLPRLASEQSVCQGLLHVPGPGEPRTFAAEYTQRLQTRGITIVAFPSVSSQALRVAGETVEKVLAKDDLANPLADAGAYVVVAARNQGILDLPEFACLARNDPGGAIQHACGIADRADYPVVTVNEGDLLGERGAPCKGSNILFHELGHLVQTWTLAPPDYFDIRQFYEDAKRSRRYSAAYALSNPNEYFAEATQAYFDVVHPEQRDRAWLRDNDPQIFELVDRIYGR